MLNSTVNILYSSTRIEKETNIGAIYKKRQTRKGFEKRSQKAGNYEKGCGLFNKASRSKYFSKGILIITIKDF